MAREEEGDATFNVGRGGLLRGLAPGVRKEDWFKSRTFPII